MYMAPGPGPGPRTRDPGPGTRARDPFPAARRGPGPGPGPVGRDPGQWGGIRGSGTQEYVRYCAHASSKKHKSCLC